MDVRSKTLTLLSLRNSLLFLLTKDKSSEAASEIGSQEEASDYDVDEEYDNDYAENYFDNGEGDDFEDLGGGGGGDDGGGKLFSYSRICIRLLTWAQVAETLINPGCVSYLRSLNYLVWNYQ